MTARASKSCSERREMSRVKRSVHAKKKRRATLPVAKGFRGDASRHYKPPRKPSSRPISTATAIAATASVTSVVSGFKRINAAARINGLSYSQFMHGLQTGGCRAGPQGARGHRRPRRRHLPTLCRPRPRGAGGRLSESHPRQHRVIRRLSMRTNGARLTRASPKRRPRPPRARRSCTSASTRHTPTGLNAFRRCSVEL